VLLSGSSSASSCWRPRSRASRRARVSAGAPAASVRAALFSPSHAHPRADLFLPLVRRCCLPDRWAALRSKSGIAPARRCRAQELRERPRRRARDAAVEERVTILLSEPRSRAGRCEVLSTPPCDPASDSRTRPYRSLRRRALFIGRGGKGRDLPRARSRSRTRRRHQGARGGAIAPRSRASSARKALAVGRINHKKRRADLRSRLRRSRAVSCVSSYSRTPSDLLTIPKKKSRWNGRRSGAYFAPLAHGTRLRTPRWASCNRDIKPRTCLLADRTATTKGRGLRHCEDSRGWNPRSTREDVSLLLLLAPSAILLPSRRWDLDSLRACERLLLARRSRGTGLLTGSSRGKAPRPKSCARHAKRAGSAQLNSRLPPAAVPAAARTHYCARP